LLLSILLKPFLVVGVEGERRLPLDDVLDINGAPRGEGPLAFDRGETLLAFLVEDVLGNPPGVLVEANGRPNSSFAGDLSLR
jgi:hypothetical protein